MNNIERELPFGFYSKKHIISFFVYVILSVIIDIVVVSIMYKYEVDGIISLIALMVVLAQLVVGVSWLKFPIYWIEKRFNKKRDYNKLKESFEKIISNELNRESKNYVRLILLRYALVYEYPYATKILKDIYLPRRTTDTLQVAYYQALFEYYIANGSHTKAKGILEAMAEYRVPKNIYNRYSLLYSVYMEYEIDPKELIAFNPVSKDYLERMISQFGLAIYSKTVNNKEKYELYRKHLNKACPNNPYFRQITK